MHVLVKVKVFNFLKLCNRHEVHSRDEHGSGLDRTGSDWIRTGSGLRPILAGSGLDRTTIFWRLADQDCIGLKKYFLFQCYYS